MVGRAPRGSPRARAHEGGRAASAPGDQLDPDGCRGIEVDGVAFFLRVRFMRAIGRQDDQHGVRARQPPHIRRWVVETDVGDPHEAFGNADEAGVADLRTPRLRVGPKESAPLVGTLGTRKSPQAVPPDLGLRVDPGPWPLDRDIEPSRVNDSCAYRRAADPKDVADPETLSAVTFARGAFLHSLVTAARYREIDGAALERQGRGVTAVRKWPPRCRGRAEDVDVACGVKGSASGWSGGRPRRSRRGPPVR